MDNQDLNDITNIINNPYEFINDLKEENCIFGISFVEFININNYIDNNDKKNNIYNQNSEG